MNYIDELILKKREDKKKQSHTLLENGVYIKGKVMNFKRQNINDIFSIILPTVFKIMPEKLAQVKYPSAFRPQRIYTNRDLSVNIGFSTFPNNLELKDAEKVANRIMETIYRENPNCRLYDNSHMKNSKGYWFAFQSHAMDSELFNMMLITPVKNTLLQASFNCPFEEWKEWKSVVVQMWESIEN